jgi:3',5'-cyclic-AMP phosphodiesterase
MIIAQITDCHISSPGALIGGRIDTTATLEAVVDHLNNFKPKPDVVLATGDLVNTGHESEYQRLGHVLAKLQIPVLPVPGNHDDRTLLRSLFKTVVPAGSPEEPIDYVVDDLPVRLIGLDTSIPGQGGGHLQDHQLQWLDQTLSDGPDRPTIIFQHHPPFITGIDWMDNEAFIGSDKLAAVLTKHRQVEAVVCGHLHRPIHRRFGGTIASCWPSTGAQLALALNGDTSLLTPENPACAIHRWNETTGLTSHLSQVGPQPWRPDTWTQYPADNEHNN